MSHLVAWTAERGAWRLWSKARGRVCLEPGAGPVMVVLGFGGRALKAVTFVASINLY